jgi:hypothetical protein
MSCSFDQAVPGTGPPRLVGGGAPSTESIKYNQSFDLSLRSKSDLNLNPQPEGFVKAAFPKSPRIREGVYAIETDRGELSPTLVTPVNLKGQRQFQNRLQDDVKPTTKETTLYTYDAGIAPVTKSQALYSQFIPTYVKVNGKNIRTSGSSNYGLRSATEYSYIPGAGPTSINTSVIQNPDQRLGKNTQPISDFNVDGPSTFKGSLPDGTKFQQYRVIATPTTNALKLNYNLETGGSTLHDYSQLLGKPVNGIENRYTASYQVAPLLSNPLSVIWNPGNVGEIPALYTNQNAQDYSYINMKKLPEDQFVMGGYNDSWKNDPSKDSNNAYVLNMEQGVYNPRINWNQGLNDKPGTIVGDKALPGASYSGNRSFSDMFNNDSEFIKKAYPYAGNMYATLGDPNAGQMLVK